MEGLILIVIVVGLLMAFDVLAMWLGEDSRSPMGDDHARPVNGWPRW